MARGGTDKYYNPTNKVVNDGDIAFADDLNSINYATDSAFAQIADDLDEFDTTIATVAQDAQEWASNAQGVLPDPLVLDTYSAKAYSVEAKEWASNADGVVIHKADGTTQLFDSAWNSATKAKAQADISTAQAVIATTQAGIATTQAGLANTARIAPELAETNAETAETNAELAETNAETAEANALASQVLAGKYAVNPENVIVTGSDYSALHWAAKSAASAASFTPTSLLNSIKTIDGSLSGLDADLLDGQHASFFAPINSPALTGVPTVPTAAVDTSTTQVATTAFVTNQMSNDNPLMNSVAAPGTSKRGSRKDHVHPSDTAKANLAGGATFTGTIVLPATTSIGTVNSTEIGYVDGVTSGIQGQINLKAPLANPTFSGTVVLPATTSIGTVSSIEIGYVDGVTSGIQGQINLKAPLLNPTFSGTIVLPTTTSVGNVSSTEIGYLNGVTSAIQTQFNLKAPLANPTFTGTVVLPGTTSIGTVSSTELGYLNGVTSAIQTQLNVKANKTLLDTGAIIAPAGTTAERPGGSEKYMRYNSDLSDFEGYNGTSWSTLSGSMLASDINYNIGSLGFRNKIINGNFDIWQRGESFTASDYTADRWVVSIAGACTLTKETTDLPSGSTSVLKWTSVGATSYAQIRQWLETDIVRKLRGKVITVSALVKGGGGYVGQALFESYYSTSTDMQGPTFVTQVPAGNLVGGITTEWSKLTQTLTVPMDAVGVYIGLIPANTQTSGAFCEIAQFQLEEGSVATPFEQRLCGLELELCRRYYRESRVIGAAWNTQEGSDCGVWFNAADFYDYGSHSLRGTPMRVPPTMVFYATISGSVGNVLNLTNLSDVLVTTLLVGTSGYRIATTAGTATHAASWQWSAEAEL